MLEIKEFHSSMKEDWDNFVHLSPNGSIFHTIGWRDVLLKTFPYKPKFFVVFEHNRISGVLPLFSVPRPIRGQKLISVPFGVYGGICANTPESCNALLNVSQKLAIDQHAEFLELRQIEKVNNDLPTSDLYVTFIREILDGEEKNFSAIPRKQRRMIRQGIEHGLQAHIGGEELLKDFYFVYSSSLRNLGTPAFPYLFFENLFQELKEQCKILCVSYQGKIVAGVLTFLYQDRVMPYYGGGLTAYLRYAIYDFMYWELLRFSWEHGYKIFDFGRSKRDTGAYHFKRHWGFEPQSLPYQFFLPNGGPIPNLNPTNPKIFPLIALWKQFPLSVANLVGPYIIKYLP